jgi:ribosomal protein S18 acetylase RimI-like enzyme
VPVAAGRPGLREPPLEQDGERRNRQALQNARMSSTMSVRAISLEDTRSLRQAVLRPHQTVEEMARDEGTDAYAVGAFEADQLVAVGLVARNGEPGAWRIRGMASAPSARGRGAGTAVLDALLGHAVAHGAQRIWCNARTPARSLYERAGLRVVSEEFVIPDIGPHFVMELRR